MRPQPHHDDTRVKRPIKSPVADCPALQTDLQSIYDWAEEVNMEFNGDKFELIRFWPGGNKPVGQYLSSDSSPIEEKAIIKDLGIKLSNDLCFTPHIENTIAGANRIVGMLLRTFRRRTTPLMVTLWKTLVQPKLDYCSQLWSPSDQLTIGKLESLMRAFTAKVDSCTNMNYWERLQLLKMNSQERRRERYQIIFLWKVSQGLVTGYNVNFTHSPRRGRLAVVPPFNKHAPANVRNARESSLAIKGAKMFNLIPAHIRNIDAVDQNIFKMNLDLYLSSVPDQPTIQEQQRAAKTNSLLDQIPMLLDIQ